MNRVRSLLSMYWFLLSYSFKARIPFLESPANFSRPKTNIQIEIKRIRARVLASKLLHFVSLTNSFIILDAKLLKLRSLMQAETAYRDFRETGPRKTDAPTQKPIWQYLTSKKSDSLGSKLGAREFIRLLVGGRGGGECKQTWRTE